MSISAVASSPRPYSEPQAPRYLPPIHFDASPISSATFIFDGHDEYCAVAGPSTLRRRPHIRHRSLGGDSPRRPPRIKPVLSPLIIGDMPREKHAWKVTGRRDTSVPILLPLRGRTPLSAMALVSNRLDEDDAPPVPTFPQSSPPPSIPQPISPRSPRRPLPQPPFNPSQTMKSNPSRASTTCTFWSQSSGPPTGAPPSRMPSSSTKQPYSSFAPVLVPNTFDNVDWNQLNDILWSSPSSPAMATAEADRWEDELHQRVLAKMREEEEIGKMLRERYQRSVVVM